MMGHPQIGRWLDDLRTCRQVGLDTNVLIYLLDNVQPYRELAGQVLQMMDRGLMVGCISTIVEAEMLVRPIRDRNRRAQETIELFLRNSPNLVLRGVDRAVAKRAAEVRAASRLRLPDAIVVATAIEERCDVLIGNDGEMSRGVPGIQYLHLDDYIT
jgi:predicted nucleic acid-binding protein